MGDRIAEIYMSAEKDTEQGVWDLEFSLHLGSQKYNPENMQRLMTNNIKIAHYQDMCRKVAEMYLQEMKEQGLRRYRINNGHIVDEFTQEVTQREGLPGDGVQIFRTTIDSVVR